jgi:hypothetical protein
VSVTHGAEVQDGGREAERVTHGDEVQHRLGRVERRPDRGQRHVGDREVQVGDGGDQDEGDQHDAGAFRGSRVDLPDRTLAGGVAHVDAATKLS